MYASHPSSWSAIALDGLSKIIYILQLQSFFNHINRVSIDSSRCSWSKHPLANTIIHSPRKHESLAASHADGSAAQRNLRARGFKTSAVQNTSISTKTSNPVRDLRTTFGRSDSCHSYRCGWTGKTARWRIAVVAKCLYPWLCPENQIVQFKQRTSIFGIANKEFNPSIQPIHHWDALWKYGRSIAIEHISLSSALRRWWPCRRFPRYAPCMIHTRSQHIGTVSPRNGKAGLSQISQLLCSNMMDIFYIPPYCQCTKQRRPWFHRPASAVNFSRFSWTFFKPTSNIGWAWWFDAEDFACLSFLCTSSWSSTSICYM